MATFGKVRGKMQPFSGHGIVVVVVVVFFSFLIAYLIFLPYHLLANKRLSVAYCTWATLVQHRSKWHHYWHLYTATVSWY